MPPRILTVLKANKAPTESICLFSCSHYFDFRAAWALRWNSFLVSTFSKPRTCTPFQVQPRMLYVSVFWGCLFFLNNGGCFYLGCTCTTLVKSCQSNTCNLLLDVRHVKYAHPPCLTAIPKPNSIIPVCVSTVFINRFHQPFSSFLP